MVLSMYDRLFGDRDPVAEPGTATGTPGDWWTVFANSPDVMEHACRGFSLYAGPDRKVAPALRHDSAQQFSKEFPGINIEQSAQAVQ